MNAQSNPPVLQGFLPVENAQLFYREVGRGQPIVLLHGGPDFDHTYLLPDMDRLADAYRLIYYDQRGRGKSAPETQPESVTLKSEIEDLERLRQFFQLDSMVVLGHSWGGILAMAYAIRHPERVSHMILMDTAPASHEDWLFLRQELGKRIVMNLDKLSTLKSSEKYAEGDSDTVTEYYRLWFTATIKKREHLDALMRQMRLSFTNEVVLRSRAIEDHLYEETSASEQFDLLPKLKHVNVPTLIIRGDYDFIPAECSAHVAEALPNARFVTLQDCGHFPYLEAPDEVRKLFNEFFAT